MTSPHIVLLLVENQAVNPFTYYVGVLGFGAERTYNLNSYITHNLVAMLLGDVESDVDEDTCIDRSKNDYVITVSNVISRFV